MGIYFNTYRSNLSYVRNGSYRSLYSPVREWDIPPGEFLEPQCRRLCLRCISSSVCDGKLWNLQRLHAEHSFGRVRGQIQRQRSVCRPASFFSGADPTSHQFFDYFSWESVMIKNVTRYVKSFADIVSLPGYSE